MEEERLFRDQADLVQLTERLRDVHLIYKEAAGRHSVSMDTSVQDRLHRLIYFSKPESIFCKNTDAQAKFRQKVLNKISEIPTPGRVPFYPDTLLTEYKNFQSKTNPRNVRAELAEYFLTQAKLTQQRKMKYLVRWIYLTQQHSQSFPLDEVNSEIEVFNRELDTLVARYERLRVDEEYPGSDFRPSPKTDEGTNLFVEEPVISYSSVSKDDVTEFIRINVEQLREERPVTRFFMRLRWLWVNHRFDVWKHSQEYLCKLKGQSIERMKLLLGDETIGQRKIEINLVTNINLRNLKRQRELMQRAKAVHSTFAEEHMNLNEQLLNSSVDEFDFPPSLITTTKQMFNLLDTLRLEFKLIGDLQIDDGHSLVYQITHMFQERFEQQKERLNWLVYDQYPAKEIHELMSASLQNMKVHRVSTIRKAYNNSEQSVPNTTTKTVKPVALKNDWLNQVTLSPRLEEWQRRQQAVLSKIGHPNQLLLNAFQLLELQDFSAMNKVLEDLALNYSERAAKKGVMKTELGLTDNMLKRGYFSALLGKQDPTPVEHEEEKVELPNQPLKALYTLRILKSRESKQRILEYLNVFRSIQRTLNLTVSQLTARELLAPDSGSAAESPLGPALHFFPDKMPHLYGLQDSIEEIDGNLFVKDYTGQYILYQVAQEDMTSLLEELMQIGSHYIEKCEIWSGEEGENFPAVDRDWLVGELFDQEVEFQQAKFKILKVYLEIFNHTVSKEEQLKLSQVMTDLIALRPRLNLRASYFTQSYWAHIDSLAAQHTILLAVFNSVYEHLSNSLSPLEAFRKQFTLDLYPTIGKLSQIHEFVQASLKELQILHETENPVALSTLEKAVWEAVSSDWRYSQLISQKNFEEGVVLDQPDLILRAVKELQAELLTKQWKLVPVIPPEAFTGHEFKLGVPEISELELVCNVFVAWKCRQALELTVTESSILEEFYTRQCLQLKKDSGPLESADWHTGLKYDATIDDGPGARSAGLLAIFELDPKMRAHMNLSNLHALKALILPWGIKEFQAAVQYQAMHQQLLAIAVQINQYGSDKWLRQIYEVKLASESQFIPRKSKSTWSNILGRKGEGVIPEKVEAELTRLQTRLSSDAGKFFFSIKEKKLKARSGLELAFKRICLKYQKVMGSHASLPLVVRLLRSQLVQGYCKEVLREAYHDSIKIQMMKVANEYRRTVRICPDHLHNQFFEDIETELRPRVLIDEEGNIVNPGHLPSIQEILQLKSFRDEEKAHWPDWNPYLCADTPEVSRKKKKQAADPDPVLIIKNSWQYPSLLKKQFQLLVYMYRTIQVRLFCNFLNENVLDVLELFDVSMEGGNYWKKEGDHSQEFTHAAVEQMLDAQSPQESLEEKIKDALNVSRLAKAELAKIPPDQHLKYFLRLYQESFTKLSFALFHTLNHSLVTEQKGETQKILEFITNLFQLKRKKCSLPSRSLAPLFTSPPCELLLILEKIHFIDHSYDIAKNGLIPGGYIWDFDWGLMNSARSERAYVLAALTTADLKTEPYVSTTDAAKNGNNLDILEETLTCLNIEVNIQRLKSALFAYKTTKDYITDPELYERVTQQYRETIEWKSQFTTNPRDNKVLARSLAEYRLLRESFEAMLCTFSIRFIEHQTKILAEANRTDQAYASSQEFSCNVDGNYVDLTKKVSVLHSFLNTLRNRCTIVDAPSCGKALVFSIKDMSQLTRRFAEQLLRFGEAEFRAREEVAQLEQDHLQQQLVLKDKTITYLKTTLETLRTNTEHIVNAQLSQKGNQLIYELDIANRQLQEIKSNMKHLENQIYQNIYTEFRESIEEKDRTIKDLKLKFAEFKGGLSQELKADIEHYKKDAFNEIRTKHSVSTSGPGIDQIISQDEQHNRERRHRDLVLMQQTIRKMRTMHQWSQLHAKQKYEKELKALKENLSSNQYLWEQLNESQRRESLLKQELSYTQQALAAAEKLADKLQTQIEDINSQRLRLEQYRNNKGRRLNELETKLKDLKRYEHVDNRKVLSQFYRQNKILHQLKAAELDAGAQYLTQYAGFNKEVNQLKQKLRKEKKLKQEAFDQLNQMREEMQGLDQDPDSLAALWRSRYYELLEETKELKEQLAEEKPVDTDRKTRTISNLSDLLPSITRRNFSQDT